MRKTDVFCKVLASHVAESKALAREAAKHLEQSAEPCIGGELLEGARNFCLHAQDAIHAIRAIPEPPSELSEVKDFRSEVDSVLFRASVAALKRFKAVTDLETAESFSTFILALSRARMIICKSADESQRRSAAFRRNGVAVSNHNGCDNA